MGVGADVPPVEAASRPANNPANPPVTVDCDEKAERTDDHHEPDMTVIDRTGGEQGPTQLHHGQQRSQTCYGTDDLEDHYSGEAADIGPQH